jgi:uncharacterized RDD family membrane protein YckC
MADFSQQKPGTIPPDILFLFSVVFSSIAVVTNLLRVSSSVAGTLSLVAIVVATVTLWMNDQRKFGKRTLWGRRSREGRKSLSIVEVLFLGIMVIAVAGLTAFRWIY